VLSGSSSRAIRPLERGREGYEIFEGHKDRVLKVVMTP